MITVPSRYTTKPPVPHLSLNMRQTIIEMRRGGKLFRHRAIRGLCREHWRIELNEKEKAGPYTVTTVKGHAVHSATGRGMLARHLIDPHITDGNFTTQFLLTPLALSLDLSAHHPL